jgi:hypothetical protein
VPFHPLAVITNQTIKSPGKCGFQWTAKSQIEIPGFYRGFHAVGKTFADVEGFAALVRWCERAGSLERLAWSANDLATLTLPSIDMSAYTVNECSLAILMNAFGCIL